MSRSYRVTVVIERAEGLRAADSNGKSDPYVSYGRLGPKAAVSKTKVMEKTLDPVWNERTNWTFDLAEPEWTISFDVYDKDLVGKDFLGHAEIDLKKDLMKEKKQDKAIVLELGGGPKSSEKEAKKVTGKLHLKVTYPEMLLLNDDVRAKIESHPEVSLNEASDYITQFRLISGGSDTIEDKAKMALLAGLHPNTFKLIVSLSVNDDFKGFSEDVIKEIISDPDLVEYFARVMLVITGSRKEGVIKVDDFVIGHSLVSNIYNYSGLYQSSEKADALLFDLVDVDGDGGISYSDLNAYQVFWPIAMQRKMEVEFLVDPKVSAMRQKIGKADYRKVVYDVYEKYNYPEVLQSMVHGLMARAVAETYKLDELRYTREQWVGYMKNDTRRKNVRDGSKNDLDRMYERHKGTAKLILKVRVERYG